MSVTKLRRALLEWYRANRRDLPWRGESDPYKILLSEILLQQTRVDQAIPYYHRFLEAFPTLRALAQSELEAVLKVWQGLGYYARARNLYKLARELTPSTCALPTTYSELIQLPGIGPYTAAAVASIAFGEPVAAVDGNVRRVIARLEAWENPSFKQTQNKADQLLAQAAPSDWNQALMELGATVCVPQNPRCEVCPLGTFCLGKTSPGLYPAPKQRKQTAIQAVALLLVGEHGVHLEPRNGKVLGGLWGVPLEVGEGGLERLEGRFGVKGQWVGTVQHQFTHRKLSVSVYTADWNATENPQERPLSRLDRKILALI